jgi:Protein kinase domain
MAWISITGSWTGTFAVVLPLELSIDLAKASDASLSEPIASEYLLHVQGTLTTHCAAKVMDQLFGLSAKPTLHAVHVGNGAPDVQHGDWLGHTWSVEKWWLAVFVHEGPLASLPVKKTPLSAELIPATQRLTNSMPLTKVVHKDDEKNDEWPYEPSHFVAQDKQNSASKNPPITQSKPSIPSPTHKIPTPDSDNSSARRHVVRTIHGLVSPDAAKNLAHKKNTLPTAIPAPDDDAIDRTQPWYKAKKTPQDIPDIPKELGHYRVLSLLGEGGMGVVLKAEHMTLDRTVALKLMKPSLARDKTFVDRFMREARIAAALEHPNLVNVYDAAQEKGHVYMALRFMGGGDLTGQLKREGPLSEPRAIHMFSTLLSALHYINIKQLIHRDIKPGNVLLDTDFTPRLGDLGLVRHTGQEHESERMGTPAYMSPEQLLGEGELDIRSDIYSLGLTLYVALTCKQPLQGETLEETIRQVLQKDPPDPRTLVPEISEAMTQVVKKAIHKNPHERFQTPREFQDALATVEMDSLNELSSSGISWFGKIFGGRK